MSNTADVAKAIEALKDIHADQCDRDEILEAGETEFVLALLGYSFESDTTDEMKGN